MSLCPFVSLRTWKYQNEAQNLMAHSCLMTWQELNKVTDNFLTFKFAVSLKDKIIDNKY